MNSSSPLMTGTRLREAAASAELTARLTAQALAAHIRRVRPDLRHHYLSSAPLPPEAEETEQQGEGGDDEGDAGELARSEALPTPKLTKLEYRGGKNTFLSLCPVSLAIRCVMTWVEEGGCTALGNVRNVNRRALYER